MHLRKFCDSLVEFLVCSPAISVCDGEARRPVSAGARRSEVHMDSSAPPVVPGAPYAAARRIQIAQLLISPPLHRDGAGRAPAVLTVHGRCRRRRSLTRASRRPAAAPRCRNLRVAHGSPRAASPSAAARTPADEDCRRPPVPARPAGNRAHRRGGAPAPRERRSGPGPA